MDDPRGYVSDLELAIKKGEAGKFGNYWTTEEEEILKRYYGKVDTALLVVHLPGRNKEQVQAKASRMGLAGRWRK